MYSCALILRVYRYREAEPGIFHVGDIVEAQLSFVAIPCGKSMPGKFRFRVVLRSLCLEDDSETEVRQH